MYSTDRGKPADTVAEWQDRFAPIAVIRSVLTPIGCAGNIVRKASVVSDDRFCRRHRTCGGSEPGTNTYDRPFCGAGLSVGHSE